MVMFTVLPPPFEYYHPVNRYVRDVRGSITNDRGVVISYPSNYWYICVREQTEAPISCSRLLLK